MEDSEETGGGDGEVEVREDSAALQPCVAARRNTTSNGRRDRHDSKE